MSIPGAQAFNPTLGLRAPSTLLASPPPSTRVQADRVEISQPQDSSANDETAALTLRVMVKKSLLEADASGHTPLDDLEPDFVPAAAKTANAPVVLSAIPDPTTVPAGYRAVSTVALVEEEKARDLAALNRDYFAAFVPNGGYALSQESVDGFAQEWKESGYQMGLAEGMQKGAQAAVPAGYRVKLMDSEAGLKLEQKRDTLANLLGTIGSTSSALGLAANLGMNAHVAGPLALAAAPLQILGPTGSLSTMARLEHQKAALLEATASQNPGQDPLLAVVDMNPYTQMPISLGEALHNLDVQRRTQQLKTVGSSLLLGAGLASLGGWGTAARALALGSLATPLADSLPSWDQLGQVRSRNQQLRATLEQATQEGIARGLSGDEAKKVASQTLVTVQIPQLDGQGRPTGFEPAQIPLSTALEQVHRQQKSLALGTAGAVVQVGGMVAMGMGCPVMLAMGATVAIPLLARGALFPQETWDGIKAAGGEIWQNLQVVAQALGRKLGLVHGQLPAMSGAQKRLFDTLSTIAEKDPTLGQALQSSLEVLHHLPQNEQEQQAALEASTQHEAQLAQLQQNYPELATELQASMQALIEESTRKPTPAPAVQPAPQWSSKGTATWTQKDGKPTMSWSF